MTRPGNHPPASGAMCALPPPMTHQRNAALTVALIDLDQGGVFGVPIGFEQIGLGQRDLDQQVHRPFDLQDAARANEDLAGPVASATRKQKLISPGGYVAGGGRPPPGRDGPFAHRAA